MSQPQDHSAAGRIMSMKNSYVTIGSRTRDLPICSAVPQTTGQCSKYYIFWACACSLRYPACNAHAPYCHLWPAPLYHNFPHYLIKGTIFFNVFWFSLPIFYFLYQYLIFLTHFFISSTNFLFSPPFFYFLYQFFIFSTNFCLKPFSFQEEFSKIWP